MEICITATSDDLESKVDARFGRCKYFMLVDPSTMQFRAVQIRQPTSPAAQASKPPLPYSNIRPPLS